VLSDSVDGNRNGLKKEEGERESARARTSHGSSRHDEPSSRVLSLFDTKHKRSSVRSHGEVVVEEGETKGEEPLNLYVVVKLPTSCLSLAFSLILAAAAVASGSSDLTSSASTFVGDSSSIPATAPRATSPKSISRLSPPSLSVPRPSAPPSPAHPGAAESLASAPFWNANEVSPGDVGSSFAAPDLDVEAELRREEGGDLRAFDFEDDFGGGDFSTLGRGLWRSARLSVSR